MDRAFALANSGGTGRSLEFWRAQFRDPQSRVNVVEIHQAVEQWAIARYRAGLSSPSERQIRTIAFGVSGPEAGNFAALAIEIATQFAGDVEHAGAAAVIAFVEHVVGRPEIMRAALRDFVLRYFVRMFYVSHVHDVADGAHRNAVAVFYFEDRRENFVTYKKIILVAEHAVRAGQPAVAVKLVMVEAVLAHQLGILRAPAGHAVAHIEDDQSVSPVGEIGEAVLHLQVV